MVTTDAKKNENEKSAVKLTEDNMEKFVDLFIRALFSDNLKPDTPADIREKFYQHIRVVSMVHGLRALMEMARDTQVMEIVDIMTKNTHRLMVVTGTEFLMRKQTGRRFGEHDQAVLDHLKEVGLLDVVPQLPPVLAALLNPSILDGAGCDCPECVAERARGEQRDVRGNTEGRYRVECPDHGWVYLSDVEYVEQMLNPEKAWWCPVCEAKACPDEHWALGHGSKDSVV